MPDARTAAGFVLANIDHGVMYLLLRSARHGAWLPPKGHTEPGEALLAGALRETREETGIESVRVVDGFERSFEYDVSGKRGKYRKRVTYYLATTDQTRLALSDEHDDAGWFALDEALARVQYQQMRDVLKQADAFLADRV
ncbi:MAG: NUDIX domain-containing protein [Planctomycetes bacterium]|nr:NUDIX domain-containing protein [Planctomycetota bacterium]